MQIINANEIKKAFGSEDILIDFSFAVDSKDKIGLIGSNGAGKTTIFRLLTGEILPDEGELAMSKDLKIGYVKQETLAIEGTHSLRDEVSKCFEHISKLEDRINDLTLQMELASEGHLELAQKHASLSAEFERLGGFGYKSRVRATLLGLGFSEDEFDTPVNVLSGGQRTRIALSKVLLDDYDIILLDEPTNNLDIASCQWLEQAVRSYNGAVIIISHDRYFLDNVTNKTVALVNGKTKTYKGNYSFYTQQYEADRLFEEKQYEAYQKEVGRIEGIIAQQKRFNQAHNYITIKSKKKQIEHMEVVDKVESLEKTIHFRFTPRENCGNEVLKAHNLAKSFPGNNLFSNVDLFIEKGEKVFLLGDNGIGKTTLLKILTGEMQADCGEYTYGSNVRPGLYSQKRDDLNPDNTVIDEIWNQNTKMNQTDVRNALAAFNFIGEDVFKKVKNLSGGEAGRLALLKLMLSEANFLLLDEPTNHLDIASKEMLETALSEYEGTLFVISHDRYFINKLATRIYHLERERVTNYIGGYDYFLEHSKKISSQEKIVEKATSGKNNYQIRKQREAAIRKNKNSLEKCEKRIEELELLISKKESLLLTNEYSTDYVKAMDLTKEIAQIKAQLEEEYENWEALSEETFE
ncbi:MAG: ABC-F family ATP-binding cassette domain-containing protein [Eubacteriales bacterium]|nr:ABC-F family ATP-binding cassette domain-containing protein [Eubacteriales bacterium]